MEKRSTNDVHRNAMVSVFLRLLERHQGVMFLTTNRMEHMDEAFRSRISAIIEYKALDESKRNKVWKNLLNAASIKLSDDVINKLCDVEMNGRQIKNVIRMSQCLAKENDSEITEEIMFKVIDLI
jgi:AAA+ superfamily predicted ATPase